jgi:arylsulfatase A-like enzyme
MDLIRWFFIVSMIAAVALGATPEAASPPLKLPNIIVITLDTTRADRMGFLGSNRGLTPNLDAVARESVIFTRAYSQAPLTPTSHSTIFTGTYPQYHQVLTFPIPLAKDLPYLPEILKQHGYATAAFVGSIAVEPTWGVPGFERGYDKYDAGFSWNNYSPKTRYQTVERRGEEVVAHALAWLNQQPQGPVFMWVHLYDPHTPYDPPEPYKTRYAKALYDGEIAYVDSAMGKFFEGLKAAGRFDDTIVALTADHGESLGAHGEDEHGIFVYDETIHVPLLVKLAHGASAGKRIDDRVELADIMPTLLGSLDIAVPDKVQGQSMLGFLQPSTPAGDRAAKLWQDRGAYSTADYGQIGFGWEPARSLRSGKYVFIQAPRRELYEDALDPESLHNLAGDSPAVADTLSARMKAFQQATTNLQKTPKAKLDEAAIEKLAILGYMAARPESATAVPGDVGADAKDKIQVANAVLRVNNILQNAGKEARCDQAMPEIKKTLSVMPDIALLRFFLGGCYIEKQDYANAVIHLRYAVKLDPAFTSAEVNLGRSLVKTGHDNEALTAFEHVAKSEPNVMDAHVYLIVLYTKAGRTQDEIRECREVLKVLPRNFGANLSLGRALLETGDAQDAIAPLKKAMEGEPEKPGPHAALADVYDRLGREEEANRERAEAERLHAAMSREATNGTANPPRQ